MTDPRRYAPAAARNRDPILARLRAVLPAQGMILEIASGTGEHVVHFAAALPQLVFQPSDPDPDAVASISAWAASARLDNLLPPLRLDAAAARWPVEGADAILCINMIHIAPWAATLGLLAGAGRILETGAPLFLYGPYRREGVMLAPSNEAFDQDLKRRDPAWGLRSLADIAERAEAAGFAGPQVTEMPANNLGVVFVKR